MASKTRIPPNSLVTGTDPWQKFADVIMHFNPCQEGIDWMAQQGNETVDEVVTKTFDPSFSAGFSLWVYFHTKDFMDKPLQQRFIKKIATDKHRAIEALDVCPTIDYDDQITLLETFHSMYTGKTDCVEAEKSVKIKSAVAKAQKDKAVK